MLLNEPTFPRWIRPLLVQLAALSMALLQGCGESSSGPAPNSQGTGTEMRSLFNGLDLTGWVGDEDVWSVQDGVITAQKLGPGLTRDYHLVLQDLEAGDFELRYQARVSRISTNQYCTAGVLIRGVNLGTSEARGYLVDNLSSAGATTKILEPNGRGWLSRPTKTTVLPDGGVKDQLEEVAEQSTIDNLKRTFIPNDWNDYEIIGRGDRITLRQNGIVACDVVDRNEVARRLKGQLALKLWKVERYEGAKAQFRNLQFREIPSIESLRVTKRVDLLAGGTLSAFKPWVGTNAPGQDPNGVFTISKGVLRVSGGTSGFLYTTNEYSNYHLVAEFRWGESTSGPRMDQPRNSGIWVHARAGVRRTAEGFECQIRESDTGSLCMSSGQLGMALGLPKTKPFQRFGRPGLPDGKTKGYRPSDEIETPHGSWNRFEVVCAGRSLRILVNGKETIRAEDIDPQSGIIGIESYNAEIFFRKLELLPLQPGRK